MPSKKSLIAKNPIEIDPSPAKDSHFTSDHQDSNLSSDKACPSNSTCHSHKIPNTTTSMLRP